MLYFRGDIHGEAINSFSFKYHPYMRELTKDDYIFILGDCGIPWNYATEKKDLHQLKWLNNQKYKTVFIAGNHDNYDLIEQMPQIDFYGGKARQLVYKNNIYNNIIYIDYPTIINIQGQKILIIPGADSHDIKDGIIDGNDKHWKQIYKEKMKNPFCFMRVSHITWWEQEKIKIEEAKELLKNEIDFDLILSHDCPAEQIRYIAGATMLPTDGEIFLQEVLDTINYKIWLHGHMHDYYNNVYKNIVCLFYDFLSLEEIYKIQDNNNEYIKNLERRMSEYV